MRKKEILIVAGILLLAVVSLAAYRLLGRGKTATGKINVYVNGALYAPRGRGAGGGGGSLPGGGAGRIDIPVYPTSKAERTIK